MLTCPPGKKFGRGDSPTARADGGLLPSTPKLIAFPHAITDVALSHWRRGGSLAAPIYRLTCEGSGTAGYWAQVCRKGNAQPGA